MVTELRLISTELSYNMLEKSYNADLYQSIYIGVSDKLMPMRNHLDFELQKVKYECEDKVRRRNIL